MVSFFQSGRCGVLLVANYDSATGFAWWLMESFWAKLAEYYVESHEVFLAYPQITKVAAAIKSAPLRIVEKDFSKASIRFIFSQCKFLRQNKIRLIYFSDMPVWHWRYALYRLCGVRLIVVHDHTPGVRTQITGWKFVAKRLLHKLPLFGVDSAIGATEFVRHRLIATCGMPPERCYAAPNGLPPVERLPAAADLHQLFGIPRSRKIMIMSGRAHLYKGVDFALRAMSLLPAADLQNIHFVFIGSGPDLDFFKQLASELTLDNHCSFPGYQSEVLSLLLGADFAIHPSCGEVGYSLSILEYMRAGLPVIVPDNPSVCGATNNGLTGIIYPDGDAPAARDAIRSLLNDSVMCADMGRASRSHEQRYTLRETHRALLDAFSKIDSQANRQQRSG